MVVTDSPQRVGQLREKLSVVTSAWFAQRYVRYILGRLFSPKQKGLPVARATYMAISKTSPADSELGLIGTFRISIS